MNENELKEKIEKLENELSELKESFNKPQKEYKRARAEESKRYFYVGYNGYIQDEIDQQTETDDYFYETGNYFENNIKAEQYRNNLITKQQLKDLAIRLNKGVEINFEDDTQFHWCIGYDFRRNMFTFYSKSIQQDLGQVYCIDEDFLEIAKTEIGEEKLIELIKSGV